MAHKPQTVFVSHSHAANAYCRQLVAGLHRRGLDVWYGEHRLCRIVVCHYGSEVERLRAQGGR
jgi:hypothetical protein